MEGVTLLVKERKGLVSVWLLHPAASCNARDNSWESHHLRAQRSKRPTAGSEWGEQPYSLYAKTRIYEIKKEMRVMWWMFFFLQEKCYQTIYYWDGERGIHDRLQIVGYLVKFKMCMITMFSASVYQIRSNYSQKSLHSSQSRSYIY